MLVTSEPRWARNDRKGVLVQYRVVKSGAGFKVQRKVFRVWVTVAVSRDLSLAIDVCAKMSVGQAGTVDGMAAAFRVETSRIWRRWGAALIDWEARLLSGASGQAKANA